MAAAFFGCVLAGAAHAADYREELLPLTLDDGRMVEASLRLPLGEKAPYPVVMLFGGFRSAPDVLDMVRTRHPVAWASFDYPYDPPRKFEFPGSLKFAPQMRDAIHGTFEAVGKLYAVLRQRPDIDPARITVAGASTGAPFATVGAARHGIPGVILVQGFGQVTHVIQHLIARRHEKRWGAWVRWPAYWLAVWLVWYCEVPVIEDYAARLGPGQKVLLITAQDDHLIPPAASEALWTGLQKSRATRERLDLPGMHLSSSKTEMIADILQRSVEWLERQDLL